MFDTIFSMVIYTALAVFITRMVFLLRVEGPRQDSAWGTKSRIGTQRVLWGVTIFLGLAESFFGISVAAIDLRLVWYCVAIAVAGIISYFLFKRRDEEAHS